MEFKSPSPQEVQSAHQQLQQLEQDAADFLASLEEEDARRRAEALLERYREALDLQMRMNGRLNDDMSRLMQDNMNLLSENDTLIERIKHV